MKEFWDGRYSQSEYAYGISPNQYFKDKIDSLNPTGHLLLPAEGEGRNAVYAAKQGWNVTAFDYSQAGKKKALELARNNGVNLTYQVKDALELELPPEQFDCIAFIYAHFDGKIRALVQSRLLASLKQGGTVIFEAYAKDQLYYQQKYQSGGPKEAEMLFTLEDIPLEFPNIQIEELQKTEIIAQEGKYHQGPSCVIQFKGIKL